MQFGDREKKLLGYLVLVIGILVASYLGAYNGVPPLPPIPLESQSVPTQPGPPGDFVSMGQGGTFQDAIAVSVPTANATADTGLLVNNLSVAQPFSMQDAGTPVLEGYNGGGVKAYAPTAVATGVPALVVDSAGVSNPFEVRKNATPVASIDGSGNLDVGGTFNFGTGNSYPLGYASSGRVLYVAKTASITTTSVTSATHGATTAVTAYGCSLAEAPKAGATTCACSVSGTTVTCAAYVSGTTAATATTTIALWILGN